MGEAERPSNNYSSRVLCNSKSVVVVFCRRGLSARVCTLCHEHFLCRSAHCNQVLSESSSYFSTSNCNIRRELLQQRAEYVGVPTAQPLTMLLLLVLLVSSAVDYINMSMGGKRDLRVEYIRPATATALLLGSGYVS